MPDRDRDGGIDPARADAASAERLTRRLTRERAIRREAEEISERATRELYDQQQRLLLLKTVANAANEASMLEPAIDIALEGIRDHCGWALGHAWLIEEGGTLLATDRWAGDIDRSPRFAMPPTACGSRTIRDCPAACCIAARRSGSTTSRPMGCCLGPPPPRRRGSRPRWPSRSSPATRSPAYSSSSPIISRTPTPSGWSSSPRSAPSSAASRNDGRRRSGSATRRPTTRSRACRTGP